MLFEALAATLQTDQQPIDRRLLVDHARVGAAKAEIRPGDIAHLDDANRVGRDCASWMGWLVCGIRMGYSDRRLLYMARYPQSNGYLTALSALTWPWPLNEL